MSFGLSSLGTTTYGMTYTAVISTPSGLRALVLISGRWRQVQDAQLGTGLKPLVLVNGMIQQRVASEGKPIVLEAGRLRTLAAGETLLI